MADRDREAAEDGAAIWRVFPKTLAEIVASERAAATAACAAHVEEHISRAVGRAWIAEEIRALSPEGWVGVRRDDLDVLCDAAAELEARIRAERKGYDATRADEIRAALDAAKDG